MADQVKYTQKLKGDKVLVIGGSSGIGFSVAEACLENGCIVTISSSSAERVAKKVAQLQSSYPSAKDRISGHACNLGDEATLDGNIKELFEKVGKLDHVIYTAGDALAVKPLSEIDMTFVKQAGMVRFFGPLFVGKHAPRFLNPGPKSSITLTTGAVSERPSPNWVTVGGYATGIQGISRSLALDLKPIRVNLVSPGAVETELWDNFGLTEETKKGLIAQFATGMATGKVGRSEDVAESYIYLLRDHNITGSMISTNGGTLLISP